jgi:phage internal scaffolding protein
MAKPKIRTRFDRLRIPKMNKEKTKTQQHMQKATDINNIMRKYEETGILEHVANGELKFGDFSKVDSYHSALSQVQESLELFEGLPARIRKRFDNDPGQLIDFLENPENEKEAIDLGLVLDPSQIPSEPSFPDQPNTTNNESAADTGDSQPADSPTT